MVVFSTYPASFPKILKLAGYLPKPGSLKVPPLTALESPKNFSSSDVNSKVVYPSDFEIFSKPDYLLEMRGCNYRPAAAAH